MAGQNHMWVIRFGDVQQDMRRLLDHISGSRPPSVRFATRAWQPSVDVCETQDQVIVVAELAGVEDADFEVKIQENTLTIRGIRRSPGAAQRRVYHQMEILCGHFECSTTLPGPVNPEHAKASLANGLLEIVLPKSKQQIVRRLSVRVEEESK
jgi:HSP20 family protein